MCESFLPLKSYRIRAFAHETCIHVYPGYPGYPSGKFPQSTDSQLNFKHIDSNYNLLSPKVEHNFLSLSDSSSISFILLRQLFHLSTQVKYILLIKTNALNLTMKGSDFFPGSSPTGDTQVRNQTLGTRLGWFMLLRACGSFPPLMPKGMSSFFLEGV